MNTLNGFSILNHHRSLVDTHSEEDAWCILHEFFHFFDENGPEESMWFLLVLALKDETEAQDGRTRGNMIFFYEYTKMLFTAARILYENHRANKRPIRSSKRRKSQA